MAEQLQLKINAIAERIDKADKDENLIFYSENQFKTKEHEVLHKIMHENKELAHKLIDKVMDLYNKNEEAEEILTKIYRFYEGTKCEEFLVNTYIANKYGDEKTSYGWKADKLDPALIEEIDISIKEYLSS